VLVRHHWHPSPADFHDRGDEEDARPGPDHGPHALDIDLVGIGFDVDDDWNQPVLEDRRERGREREAA
jgi:hypothetical protein